MAAILLKPRKKRPCLGPYSRRNNLTSVDGRCRVARCMRDFARELERHLGGNPTPAQRILIREASIKDAKLTMMVDRILSETEPDMDCATRTYLAWANSLRRDLEALGLKSETSVQAVDPLGYIAAKRKAAA
jgi:hypothetical protein